MAVIREATIFISKYPEGLKQREDTVPHSNIAHNSCPLITFNDYNKKQHFVAKQPMKATDPEIFFYLRTAIY